jgi:hypothetical protein
VSFHSAQQYSWPQNSGPQYPGQQNSGHQNPAQQYPAQQYPTQQYPGQQFPVQPHPVAQYAAGRPPVAGTGFAPPAFPARPDARYSAPPAQPAPRPRRRRLAIVVGLLVVAGLAAAAVVIGAAAQPVRVPDTGAIAAPGTLSVFELQAGDCYNTTQTPPAPGQSQPISVVQAVQCTAAHTSQVVGKITYSTTEYATGVPEAKSDADCTGEFQAKLDPSAFTDPTLKPGRLTPADPATWSRTPVVACVVFSDNPISRSLLR